MKSGWGGQKGGQKGRIELSPWSLQRRSPRQGDGIVVNEGGLIRATDCGREALQIVTAPAIARMGGGFCRPDLRPVSRDMWQAGRERPPSAARFLVPRPVQGGRSRPACEPRSFRTDGTPSASISRPRPCSLGRQSQPPRHEPDVVANAHRLFPEGSLHDAH